MAAICCARIGFAGACFARFSFAETRFARFQVALKWGGQLGTGLGGMEETALLLQFGGFAKQGVGGVEALEIFGGGATVVFTGEFEVVGGGVEQTEEVGGAEGLAAFAADGVPSRRRVGFRRRGLGGGRKGLLVRAIVAAGRAGCRG